MSVELEEVGRGDELERWLGLRDVNWELGISGHGGEGGLPTGGFGAGWVDMKREVGSDLARPSFAYRVRGGSIAVV